MTEHWFLTPVPRPRASVQLFCFPYAGGGPSMFAAWPQAMGPDVEVSAVVLPGRERRMAEEPVIDPVRVAAVIAERADRPFAFFGYSLGARLAFEVARELRRTGRTLPTRLFVGACQSPEIPRGDGPYDGLSELDDDALVARLAEGGGIPDAILAAPDLLELLLPTFRADFTWLDEHVHQVEPPLPIPVTAFSGQDDPAATAETVDGWRRHTTSGFSAHVLPGGHFFVHDRLPELRELICADLRADAAPGRPGGGLDERLGAAAR